MSPHLRKEGKDCVGSQAATRWRTGAGTFGLHESETLQSLENQKQSWWPADANLRASKVEDFSQIPAFQPSSHANLWQASSWGWSNKGDLILWHSRKELVIERRETGFDYFTGTPQWHTMIATECFYFGSSRGREEVPPAMSVWREFSFAKSAEYSRLHVARYGDSQTFRSGASLRNMTWFA